MENKFLLSRLRKTALDHMRANSELYTAVEEFVEDPSQASLEVIASKLKGFDSTSNILQDTIKGIAKEINEENKNG